MFGWIIFYCVVAVLLILILAWRPLRSLIREVHAERAVELFKLQREHLEAAFLKEASASGKPRGLRWKACNWEPEIRYAREKDGGRILALAEVNISFEAIEGSDMEGLPAVGNLRNASAVFAFSRGRWNYSGKVLFNMNPSEAIDHLKKQIEPVELR